jgi:hypothetical protein
MPFVQRGVPDEQQKVAPEKKADSYEKDRRNRYGENSKSSRKNIPLAKARDHREARRVTRQGLVATKGAVDDEAIDKAETRVTTKRHPRFKKQPDKPLGSVVATKKRRRAASQ